MFNKGDKVYCEKGYNNAYVGHIREVQETKKGYIRLKGCSGVKADDGDWFDERNFSYMKPSIPPSPMEIAIREAVALLKK